MLEAHRCFIKNLAKFHQIDLCMKEEIVDAVHSGQHLILDKASGKNRSKSLSYKFRLSLTLILNINVRFQHCPFRFMMIYEVNLESKLHCTRKKKRRILGNISL